jgi:hypothetical protein
MDLKKCVLVFLTVCLLFASACTSEEKFDRTKWYYGDGIDFPFRDKMVGVIVSSHMLDGLRYPKVVGLLHPPQERDSSSHTIYYDVLLNYNLKGSIHKKMLAISFTKDSVVKKVAIIEQDVK